MSCCWGIIILWVFDVVTSLVVSKINSEDAHVFILISSCGPLLHILHCTSLQFCLIKAKQMLLFNTNNPLFSASGAWEQGLYFFCLNTKNGKHLGKVHSPCLYFLWKWYFHYRQCNRWSHYFLWSTTQDFLLGPFSPEPSADDHSLCLLGAFFVNTPCFTGSVRLSLLLCLFSFSAYSLSSESFPFCFNVCPISLTPHLFSSIRLIFLHHTTSLIFHLSILLV